MSAISRPASARRRREAPSPPPANEAGWKDTVAAYPGHITRVIARFQTFTGIYPYHCHILEHEDNEMMRAFGVLPKR